MYSNGRSSGNITKHRATSQNSFTSTAQKRSVPVVDLTEDVTDNVKLPRIEKSNSSTSNSSSHSSNNKSYSICTSNKDYNSGTSSSKNYSTSSSHNKNDNTSANNNKTYNTTTGANKNRTVTPPRAKFTGISTSKTASNVSVQNTYTSNVPSHTITKNASTSSTTAPNSESLSASPQRDEWIQNMESEIIRHYYNIKQTDETYQRKLELVDTLYSILANAYPSCGLYLVGSSVNGLGFDSCNVDLCLMLTRGEISKDNALSLLYQIKKLFYPLNRVKKLNVIKATVPILDFYDAQTKAECDMNINNETVDKRVAPLVMFIKKWAKFQNINSAKDRTISSYALTLMVLHYLQYGIKGHPVVPCLQRLYPQNFPDDITQLKMDLKFLPLPHQNTMSLGELLLGFFQYYTNQFRYTTQVASVRLGNTMHINEVRQREEYYGVSTAGNFNHRHGYSRSTWRDACIFVEEPFNFSNAARCVYNTQVFDRIMRVFRRSHQTLQHTKDVNSIILHPF